MNRLSFLLAVAVFLSGAPCPAQSPSDGFVLVKGRPLLEPFPGGWTPLEWGGDVTRELLNGRAEIGNFNGKEIVPAPEAKPVLPPRSSVLMTADLYGDFRDELVLSTTNPDGKRAISVVTAVHPISSRYVTATESLDYRLWLARNMGGGYRSVYDLPLKPARAE